MTFGARTKTRMRSAHHLGSSVIRKRLVAQLDQLYAAFIKTRDKRAYGGCFYCNKPIQHVFHLITRSKYSVRWDERNGLGSCAGCNLRYEHDTVFIVQVHEVFRRRFGEMAWVDLLRRGNQPAKFSMDELRAIKKRLEDSMQGVCISRATFGTKA